MARRKAAPKPQAEAADTPAPQVDDQSHTPPADSTAPDFPFGALAPGPSDIPGIIPASQLQPQPPSADHQPTKPGSRPHVRSWSRDLILGYQILTDDRLKLIVLRFDERPADAVLAMVKDMGFKYRELREHGRVWVTPNDWEGRTLTDQLEHELYRYRTGQERAGQGVA